MHVHTDVEVQVGVYKTDVGGVVGVEVLDIAKVRVYTLVLQAGVQTTLTVFVGVDVLNNAMERVYTRVLPDKWVYVNVAIAPSTITISEHGVSEPVW